MSSPLLADRRNSRDRQSSNGSQTAIDRLTLHPGLLRNPDRTTLIRAVLDAREAILTQSGALTTWTPKGETGRIPKDTYIVRRPTIEHAIDWTSPACIPMEPQVFDRLLGDALAVLNRRKKLIILDRSVGADQTSALPLEVITDSPLSALFSDTMFRAAFRGEKSVLDGHPFTLLALPHEKIQTETYEGVLRTENGRTVDMAIAMDYERRIGLVYGIAYCGAVKKTVFTTMNTLLPEKEILPLHCAASAGSDGTVALFLGLSGTGKTTLSAIPGRTLLGDDEHLWSDRGIANMEGGCYAKLIHLQKDREPNIFTAVFTKRPQDENGVIIENAMVFPDGSIDLDDERFTENSRASYPLTFLPGADPASCGGHPKTILFLTADAEGVLPPIAHLTPEEAERWFLLGYTSKLAGTEAGVKTPQPNFSRFFGGPFMPRQPRDYTALFSAKVRKHGCSVYLVNTGWSGGPYGVGKRMEIAVSRAVVDAAISGTLESVPVRRDPYFGFQVPERCPGVESALLNPRSTWKGSAAYDSAAGALARKMDEYPTKTFPK